MPRYEIVAHVERDLDCSTPEEAAALIGAQLRAGAEPGALLHLAVWCQEPPPAASPLPPALRRGLVDFFVAVERHAVAAEAVFRDRVAAILDGPPGGPDRPPVETPYAR